jgi:ribose transport system ATP-binding protein
VELIARGLVKRYPGVVALDGVALTVRSSEVHAVVGENGAGKSSLMKILSGATAPDAGEITVDGMLLVMRTPRDAHRAGIRMIHQELSLVPELTVAENVFLGAEPSRCGVVRRGELERNTRHVLARLGQGHIAPGVAVGSLSLAAQQMTEIAKAIACDARILIMDEPTAILAQHEAEALFAVVRQLRADGVAVVYITHRMAEVYELADRVTVLRDGAVVSTGVLASYDRSDIVMQMVGRELASGFPEAVALPGAELLRVTGLRTARIRDASLTVRAGEIVALVGLVGAGRTELLRAVFGAEETIDGAMALASEPYRPASPADAISRGVALLPEDRKHEGLILDASVRENSAMAILPSLATHGVVRRDDERTAVSTWISALRIRTPSQEQPVRMLSGGNQQKVVLARWMLAKSKLLLVDEPTRGIDVGARAEIYALLRDLTERGAGVLMVSSDLNEALGLADRVIVMRDGVTTAELSRADATPQRVAALILGEAA